MIAVEKITFGYTHGDPVFLNFSWNVQRGERWAILGPSGCGKSTLLYLLAGLRFPTSGQIHIDGQPVNRPRPQSGLILQEYGLLPWANVEQNATLGLRIRKFYGSGDRHVPDGFVAGTDAEHWLERLGISAIRGKYPGQISGGQRQRTAIARTLAIRPDLLLMDEPFSSLDAPTREDLQNLTLELQQEEGLTLILVTHAIEEAAVLGRKILLLHRPPNREPVIIDNPTSGTPDFRSSSGYLDRVRDLRMRMEERRTSHAP